MGAHQFLNPEGLAPPVGFSHVAVATPGRLVFLAGETAHQADGTLAGSTIAQQFAAAAENVAVALAAAGATPADVVSLLIYTTDVDAYRAETKPIGAAYRGVRPPLPSDGPVRRLPPLRPRRPSRTGRHGRHPQRRRLTRGRPQTMSPERNRVTPTGEIVAIPLRGAWTGNRGILHRGHEIVRFHAGDLWITCALQFKDRHQEQWRPGHYTFLFFHDEAVSFAAGHRPCAECRRSSYNAYRDAWATGLGCDLPSARDMNRQLHRERVVAGSHRRRIHELPWRDLPDGTFVLLDGIPTVVVGDHLAEWTHAGYGRRRARPRTGPASVLTPPSTVAALGAGYDVQIDASAR